MTEHSAREQVRRRPAGARNLASVHTSWPEGPLPALVRAERAGIDLAAWVAAHGPEFTALRTAAGAVLLRGFQVTDAQDFLAAVEAISHDVLPYGERSSPRSEIIKGIYTSTDHPADQPIALHNEQSYTNDWPLLISFFCDVPPEKGGRTPLADSRRVLGRLAPGTVARFERHGVCYVRNYRPGISLTWQEVFQTDSRAVVERYCCEAGIEAEWIGADQLRTSQVRPAVHVHPGSGERTWFNHALFFHVMSLPSQIRADLMSAVAEADLPYNTYYGDGRPIDLQTIAELRAAYAAETKGFTWERGDVLVVENMLVAHGREPFTGPRRILTAMADRYSAGGGPR